jgi:hypothetical protein
VLSLRLAERSRMLPPLPRNLVVKAGETSRQVTFSGRLLEVRL